MRVHMRVRMLVRAYMHASSDMSAVAGMCAWFSACNSIVEQAYMLTSISVFASVFVYSLNNEVRIRTGMYDSRS